MAGTASATLVEYSVDSSVRDLELAWENLPLNSVLERA
jgi:hypothetical protein